eukprot:m.587910 g.587910  ORF g.587910 m.587910 type:complete len:124 (-) comp22359_c1_seq4:2521-2892(-)
MEERMDNIVQKGLAPDHATGTASAGTDATVEDLVGMAMAAVYHTSIDILADPPVSTELSPELRKDTFETYGIQAAIYRSCRLFDKEQDMIKRMEVLASSDESLLKMVKQLKGTHDKRNITSEQ